MLIIFICWCFDLYMYKVDFFFFCLDGNNGLKDKEKIEDIEERLCDIFKRFEKFGSCNFVKIYYFFFDMKLMDDIIKEILFMCLFLIVRY